MAEYVTGWAPSESFGHFLGNGVTLMFVIGIPFMLWRLVRWLTR